MSAEVAVKCPFTIGLASTPGCFTIFTRTGSLRLPAPLNAGLLPRGFYALAEQVVGGPIPDVLTLESIGQRDDDADSGGIAIGDRAARREFGRKGRAGPLRERHGPSVRHRSGDRVIAVLEILSPGNKESKHSPPRRLRSQCD